MTQHYIVSLIEGILSTKCSSSLKVFCQVHLIQNNCNCPGVTVIDQLLKKQKFRRRQALKTKATGNNPLRNQQFEHINRLIEDYQEVGNPVMSVDTKKKKNSDNSIERDIPITNNQ